MKLSRLLLLIFCVTSLQAMKSGQAVAERDATAAALTDLNSTFETIKAGLNRVTEGIQALKKPATSTVDSALKAKWDIQVAVYALRAKVDESRGQILVKAVQEALKIDSKAMLEVLTDSNINEWQFLLKEKNSLSWHPNIVAYNAKWLEDELNNYAQRLSVQNPGAGAQNLQKELGLDDFCLRIIVQKANQHRQTLEQEKRDHLALFSANSLPQPSPSAPSTATTSSEGAQTGSSSGGGASGLYTAQIPRDIMTALRLQIEQLSSLWKIPESDLEQRCEDFFVYSEDTSTPIHTLIKIFVEDLEKMPAYTDSEIAFIKEQCGIDSAEKFLQFFDIETKFPKSSPNEKIQKYLATYPCTKQSSVVSSGSSPASSTSSSTSSASPTSSAGDGQAAETKPNPTTELKNTDNGTSVDTKNTASTESATTSFKSKTTHWDQYKRGYLIIAGAVVVSALAAVGVYWYFGKKKEDKKS
jgi:hypothetical protein